MSEENKLAIYTIIAMLSPIVIGGAMIGKLVYDGVKTVVVK